MHAPTIIHSADRETMLQIHPKEGLICDAAGELIDIVPMMHGPVLTAISNNREWLAHICDEITPRIYIQRKSEKWRLQMFTQLKKSIQALAWKEPDDVRYPPLELIVTFADGTQTTISPR